MPVRDFSDGQDIDEVLLVREVEFRAKRDGGEYLRLVLADRTGRVPAIVWDGVDQVVEHCRPGRPIRVIGRFTVHQRHGAQLLVRAVRLPSRDSLDTTVLVDGPARPAEQLEADLRALVATIQAPALHALLERLLGAETETWAAFRDAPAAKHVHQAYRHGLLEHSVTVAQAVSSIAATFGGVDRDVAVCAALLHDLGKLEAYTTDPLSIDLTEAGRLHGEIALGYFHIRREIEAIEGFPPTTAEHLLHIILSHHGRLEHGSPVLPATREATLVHFCDNLGSRMGSFDRLEKALAPGSSWSSFDRVLGVGAWFAPADEVREADVGERRAA